MASQQDKCGPSHDQECCYLKSKCQGTPGKYGRGYRIRTCGDMYAPPGKFLLADPDVPCGLDCEKCFADDNGGDEEEIYNAELVARKFSEAFDAYKDEI